MSNFQLLCDDDDDEDMENNALYLVDDDNFDDDDMADYYEDDEAARPSAARIARPSGLVSRREQRQVEQRGVVFNDMFDLIKEASNHGAKIADLLAKNGRREECQRLDNLLGRLVKCDQDLDKDRRAVDQTWEKHNSNTSEQPVLAKNVEQIRKTMRDALFGPTHNQRIIEDVRSRMASKLRETAVGTKISGPGTADDDDGEEMEMLGHFMSDKDPLTKRPIRQPVKNPICDHVYDRESIEEYIKERKERRQLYQCPVGQCKNRQPVDMKQLLPFPEFFQLVRRRSRSRSRSRNRTPNANIPGTSGQ